MVVLPDRACVCRYDHSRPCRGTEINKSDLIAAVAAATGISKSDAAGAVDSTFDVISDALRQGDDIRLTGFGTFNVADRAAREGRNPRTGEAIKIAASRQPKFKAGKGLKDVVNG
jgi:DNA-binding protein HU-beta